MIKTYIIFFFFVLLTLPIFEASAQLIKSKDVDAVESLYLVTDSAIFDYYLGSRDVPYKLYDFSTRKVYIYFGVADEKEQLAIHSFDDIAPDEMQYILKIGCEAGTLSSSFRRFC